MLMKNVNRSNDAVTMKATTPWIGDGSQMHEASRLSYVSASRRVSEMPTSM
jgi:hypothetical protein